MRGVHSCEFCDAFQGNGEVWLCGDDGVVYAAPSMLLHYVEAHAYLPPEVFLRALTRGEALSGADCRARIDSHRQKLQTTPTREDILVPYYSARVYWRLVDFGDLGTFEAFIARALPWQQFNSFALNDTGYFVRTECEKPDQLLRDLVASLPPSGPAPFQCAFKLLYLGGEEQVCSTPPR